MRKYLSCVVAFLVVAGILPVVAFAEANPAGLEDLLFMDVPNVVTASKMSEPVSKAPSVVYVISSDEIKRSGARSLSEILNRVPGFNVYYREVANLGSRGFTPDQNNKFVFLIDGAPITNIVQDGAYGILDMPDLDMVDHIEVVKGPGSTLYGSDASYGIINIFTKTGAQIGGMKPSMSYSTNDDKSVFNFLYGGKSDGTDYMLSLTYGKSKGFSDNPASQGFNTIYLWGSVNPNPWYGGGPLSEGTRLGALAPNIEMYSKVKTDSGLTFKARAAYSRFDYLWQTDYTNQRESVVFKHFYTEVEKENKFSDDVTLTTKVNMHGLDYERGLVDSVINPANNVSLETKTEMGVSLESILNWNLGIHRIVGGVKYAGIQTGPSTLGEFTVGTGATVIPGGNLHTPGNFVYNTGSYLDDTSGIYGEDSIGLGKLTLVGGVSYEYNDLRDKSGQLMPRAAAVYEFTDALSAKYCYNTGFNRPGVDLVLSQTYGHVTQSEKIEEQDFQINYKTDKTRASVNAFHTMLFNFINWEDFTKGNTIPSGLVGDFNTGDEVSDGVEFDLHHNFTRTLAGYVNYTYEYAQASTLPTGPDGFPVIGPSATLVGSPEQIYNFGADYYYTKDVSLDLNFNGYMNMLNGYTSDSVWYGDSQQLVNLALVVDNICDKPFTLTLVARNLLDTKQYMGMTGWPGYSFQEGASYEAKLAYKF